MGMDGPLMILAAGGILHRKDGLRDQLAGQWANNVHAQNLIVVLSGYHLGEALSLLHRAGSTAGQEGEHAGLVSPTTLLDLLLGLANPGDLRCRVDHRGDSLVVDLT